MKTNTRIAITSMSSIASTGMTIDEIWKNQINKKPAFKKINEMSFVFSQQIEKVLTSKKYHPFFKNGLTSEEAIEKIKELINGKGYLPVKIIGALSKGGNLISDNDLIEEIEKEIINTSFSSKYIKKILSLVKKGCFDTSILQSIYMSITALNKAKLLGETGVMDNEMTINFGHGLAGLKNIERRGVLNGLVIGNKRTMGPRYLVASCPNMTSSVVANVLGTRGLATSDYNACASAGFAIAGAVDQILLGRTKIALTGGCDNTSGILFTLTAFGRMGALARGYEDMPNLASRPFSNKLNDDTTKGFVFGDGGGMFTLEELDSAKSRGADILGEILSIGLSNCNPVRENLPLSSGTIQGQSLSMKKALNSAGITAEEFKEKGGVVFAHGTSTESGDTTEAKSIHNVFGNGINITALKGVIGHSLGGSSAQSLAIALKSFEENIIPGTLHYSDKTRMDGIPEGINIISENTKRDLELILINAFGFGGHNASILIKKI